MSRIAIDSAASSTSSSSADRSAGDDERRIGTTHSYSSAIGSSTAAPKPSKVPVAVAVPPKPTFLDRFGYCLASRLLGNDAVRKRLLQSAASSSSSTSPSESKSGKSKSNSFRLYWRSPLLLTASETSADDLLAAGLDDGRPESAPSERAVFVDLTFDFTAVAVLVPAIPPRQRQRDGQQHGEHLPATQNRPHVDVRLGSLVRKWQPITVDPSGRIDRTRRGLGATYVQNPLPLCMTELRRHGESIGIDLDEMEPRPTAHLLAEALGAKPGSEEGLRAEAGGSIGTSSGNADGADSADRGSSANDGGDGKDVAVRLVLFHPSLNEEGEFVIGPRSASTPHPPSPSMAAAAAQNDDYDGHVGEAALGMLLANLDRSLGGETADGPSSSSETKATEEEDDTATEEAFETWWKAASAEQQLQQPPQQKQHQPIPKRSEACERHTGSSSGDVEGNDVATTHQNAVETDTARDRSDEPHQLPLPSHAGGERIDLALTDDGDDGDGGEEEETARGEPLAISDPSLHSRENGTNRPIITTTSAQANGNDRGYSSYSKPNAALSSTSTFSELDLDLGTRNIQEAKTLQQQQNQQQQKPSATAAASFAAETAKPNQPSSSSEVPPPPPSAAAQTADSAEAASRRKRPVHGAVLVRGGGTRRKKKRGKVTIGKMR